MKNTKKVGVATTFAAIGIMNVVSAAVVDITINDGSPSAFYGNDPRPGIEESGEVTAGCTADKTWDLRAVAYDYSKNQLIVVSGFNQLTTKDGYGMGDIFFDTNTEFTSPSRPNNLDGYVNYPNPGFELCIDVVLTTDDTLEYSLIKMSESSIVQSGALAQNGFADPSTIVRSNSDILVGTGVAKVETMSDNKIRSILGIDVGKNGGPNYVSFFDLPSNFLPPNTAITVFNSLTCGNDNIQGQLSISAVPEPGNCLATMVFLCSGALIRFRRK